MEFRQLGGSGLFVPVLTLGTGTFGGGNEFFKPWGASPSRRPLVLSTCASTPDSTCSTAPTCVVGQAEEILGAAVAGRRDRVLISTKASFRHGRDPNDVGSSRFHHPRR